MPLFFKIEWSPSVNKMRFQQKIFRCCLCAHVYEHNKWYDQWDGEAHVQNFQFEKSQFYITYRIDIQGILRST